MKFAIASEDGAVSRHFGRCPEYTIIESVNGDLSEQKSIPNPGIPHGQLPDFFRDIGVNTIISGGMGNPAREKFASRNIRTVLGVSGSIEDVIRQFIQGTLESGDSLCGGSERGRHHDCGHHSS